VTLAKACHANNLMQNLIEVIAITKPV